MNWWTEICETEWDKEDARISDLFPTVTTSRTLPHYYTEWAIHHEGPRWRVSAEDE
jgi:hypothetical protein